MEMFHFLKNKRCLLSKSRISRKQKCFTPSKSLLTPKINFSAYITIKNPLCTSNKRYTRAFKCLLLQTTQAQ